MKLTPKFGTASLSGRGFQSHSWYQFGERAMAECQPTYLLAWDGDTPVASAALFRIHNEPLPLPSVARRFMASVLEAQALTCLSLTSGRYIRHVVARRTTAR